MSTNILSLFVIPLSLLGIFFFYVPTTFLISLVFLISVVIAYIVNMNILSTIAASGIVLFLFLVFNTIIMRSKKMVSYVLLDSKILKKDEYMYVLKNYVSGPFRVFGDNDKEKISALKKEGIDIEYVQIDDVVKYSKKKNIKVVTASAALSAALDSRAIDVRRALSKLKKALKT